MTGAEAITAAEERLRQQAEQFSVTLLRGTGESRLSLYFPKGAHFTLPWPRPFVVLPAEVLAALIALAKGEHA